MSLGQGKESNPHPTACKSAVRVLNSARFQPGHCSGIQSDSKGRVGTLSLQHKQEGTSLPTAKGCSLDQVLLDQTFLQDQTLPWFQPLSLTPAEGWTFPSQRVPRVRMIPDVCCHGMLWRDGSGNSSQPSLLIPHKEVGAGQVTQGEQPSILAMTHQSTAPRSTSHCRSPFLL